VDDLDALTARLEATAERLRTEPLEPDQAAALVEEAARLAGRASAELERRVREAEAAPTDQLSLEP
jgi:hypothetical protein